MTKVKVTREDELAIITIQNPPVNVLDKDVVIELLQIARNLSTDNTVRAVILTGEGTKAFMAGGNIKSFPDLIGKGHEVAYQESRLLQEPFEALMNLPQPTICVLNGLALGGGCELALSLDFRIAEAHVEIGLPEVKLGLFPGAGGTQRLSRLIGISKAKEIIFTGEPLTAQQALEIGLVNTVVPAGEGLQTARHFAKKMTRHSSQALKYAKLAINHGRNVSLQDGLKIEAHYFGDVFQTEDVKEGVQAFINKRTPKFQNR